MDKFNQDLNEVLSHALDLALDFNHVLCTTEHVLLAILEHGIGIRIFNTLEEDGYHKME
ncbi:Clp protease N-terminal domain-containing protein, partial [Helicobacter pylori]